MRLGNGGWHAANAEEEDVCLSVLTKAFCDIALNQTSCGQLNSVENDPTDITKRLVPLKIVNREIFWIRDAAAGFLLSWAYQAPWRVKILSVNKLTTAS